MTIVVDIYLGLVDIIIGIILIIYGLNLNSLLFTKSDSKVEGKVKYEWVVKEGISRIESGRLSCDRSKFISTVEKAMEAIYASDRLPEFGVEALYLYFTSRDKAQKIYEQMRTEGLDVDIQEEKIGSTIKISF
ncbi:hypothetical protein [Thermoplasma volcanium]|uniref:hypothetical protein n=1 Tax=Thermoplasma volcanium TaxID=50339 RepID=UPI00138A3E88|nr:hypothetical protein [Thermoplasma volcanium]